MWDFVGALALFPDPEADIKKWAVFSCHESVRVAFLFGGEKLVHFFAVEGFPKHKSHSVRLF